MTIAWNGPWGGRMDSHHRHHKGRRHRHHDTDRMDFGGWSPGPWGMPPQPPVPPGPHGFGPPGRGFGKNRGRKARRGNVRAAILALLAEEPRNGYQLMQEIAERSQGAWRPSPGAVYPALQQLTDEGLAQPVGEGRRTVYELTEAGTTYIAENADEVSEPWQDMTPEIDDDVRELMEVAQQSSTALMQVVQAAGPEGRSRAKEVLIDARRKLYQILAEGEGESGKADDGSQ